MLFSKYVWDYWKLDMKLPLVGLAIDGFSLVRGLLDHAIIDSRDRRLQLPCHHIGSQQAQPRQANREQGR